jgi:2'-hydroxyisoflavone reductase
MNPSLKLSLKLLVLGGTRFVGRHMVERFLQAGHQVTLLTRGKLESPFVESQQCHHIHADRNEPLNAPLEGVEGQVFDAVVDVSGYFPHQVQRVLDAVSFERYLYVSTISVYDPAIRGSFAEDHACYAPDTDSPTVTPQSYGPLKRACELLLLERIPNRVCILRPHFVVGAHDYTQRLGSWIYRLARGGPRVFPGALSNALQFVDARDHADFALLALERNMQGIFNLARDPLTWGDLVDGIQNLTQNPLTPVITPVILDAAFLESQPLEGDPFPMWIDSSGENAVFTQVPNARTKATGFAFRPLPDTLQYLLEWNAQYHSNPQNTPLTAGLSAAQERDLLERWFARRA